MPTNGSVKFGMYEYEIFFLFRISCNALYKARNKVREKGDKQSVKLVITSLILLMIGFVVIIAMMLERKKCTDPTGLHGKNELFNFITSV